MSSCHLCSWVIAYLGIEFSFTKFAIFFPQPIYDYYSIILWYLLLLRKICCQSEQSSFWYLLIFSIWEFPLWLSGLRTQLVSMRLWVPSLASLSGLRIWHATICSIGYRCGSDLTLLWLWCRMAVAAPTQHLAQEFPYATDEALNRKKCGIPVVA